MADAPSRSDADENGLELLKIIGLASMLIDHTAKFLFPMQALPAHVIGRLALPLFAFVMIVRLAEHPGRALRYLPRLFVWGVLAQIPLILLGYPTLNILFTFAAGICVQLLLEGCFSDEKSRWVAVLASVVVLTCAQFIVDYGAIGAALIPLGIWSIRRFGAGSTIALLASLCWLTQWPASAEFLVLSGLGCVLSIPPALMMNRFPSDRWFPALPRTAFYAVCAGQFWCFLLLVKLL